MKERHLPVLDSLAPQLILGLGGAVLEGRRPAGARAAAEWALLGLPHLHIPKCVAAMSIS